MCIYMNTYICLETEKDRNRDINKIITSVYLSKIKGLVC